MFPLVALRKLSPGGQSQYNYTKNLKVLPSMASFRLAGDCENATDWFCLPLSISPYWQSVCSLFWRSSNCLSRVAVRILCWFVSLSTECWHSIFLLIKRICLVSLPADCFCLICQDIIVVCLYRENEYIGPLWPRQYFLCRKNLSVVSLATNYSDHQHQGLFTVQLHRCCIWNL